MIKCRLWLWLGAGKSRWEYYILVWAKCGAALGCCRQNVVASIKGVFLFLSSTSPAPPGSKTLLMTSERLGEMFVGDFAATCGVDGPIGASGNFSTVFQIFCSGIYSSWSLASSASLYSFSCTYH